MGKVRYMAKDRWRPIYRYPYGNALVYLVCSVAATGTCIAAFFSVRGLIGSYIALFWVLEAILGLTGVLGGFFVARYLFFVTARVRRNGAAIWGLVAASGFPGICLLWAGSGPGEVALGTGLLCVPLASLIITLARCKWIALYTDGVVIGKLVLKYADFVYTEFTCGKPYLDHVPEQGKGKPIVVLTSIDYEYEERDFGVMHYYCFIVTKDTTYVAQSLTNRSDFVANVRNGWSCYDWDRRQKAIKEKGG